MHKTPEAVKMGCGGGMEVGGGVGWGGGGVGAGDEPEVSVELTNESDLGKCYYYNSE